MKRKTALALIPLLCISLLSIVGYTPKALGQTGTSVSSQIITKDTTWTQTGSPYTFMGPVGVATGVTLTIDAGVTVNIGSNNFIINGTLDAQGTSTAKVTFTSGFANNYPAYGYPDIILSPNVNSACNIENTIFNNTSLQSVRGSVKINNCVFTDGSGISQAVSSAIITNSYITGFVIIEGGIISNDTLLQGLETIAGAQNNSISNNYITNPGGTVLLLYGSGTISGNIISGGSYGIDLETGCTIEDNLIINNGVGISIDPMYGGGVIDNNTIANNSGGGIKPTTGSDTINFNNLENNGQFNLASASSGEVGPPALKYTFPVNATYNWWGTTNTEAINQTIDDNYNNYGLGTVSFTPFLTAPNPQAPSINTALTTPTLSSTPSPTPKSTLTSPNPTTTPQNPTTGTQTKTGPNIYWLGVALSIAVTAVVVLAFTVAVLTRKNGKRAK